MGFGSKFFEQAMQQAATRNASMQSKSWWPDYVQAYSQGKDALMEWAQTAGQRYADFDGATDGNFVGSQVAGLQAINSGSSWDKVGDVTGTLGKIGVGASLLYAGGVGAGLAGEGAAAGGAAAGDAAVAGGAGADALAGDAAIAGGAGADSAVGGAGASGAAGGGTFAATAAPEPLAAAAPSAASGGYGLGSGMTVDEAGNVTGAAAGAGGSGIMGVNPQLAGAVAGGLLGGLGGGNRPAGTTTSTQDVPAWLMPYVTGNLNAATGARDALIASPDTTAAAIPEYMKTIRGDYLNPATNPYLDATYNHAAGLVGAGVDSRFEAGGRYGSGAHQGVLQEGFNNLANTIYGGNYQAERARQVAAVTGAPAFDTGTSKAAFAPYSDYASLFPGNSRSTTTPYFTNTAGGILGGALAGSQLMRMYG